MKRNIKRGYLEKEKEERMGRRGGCVSSLFREREGVGEPEVPDTESRTGEEPLIDQSKENYPPLRKYF